MDTARLETSRFKKCCENCITVPGTTLVLNSRVLLMYADTVRDLPGYPVTVQLGVPFFEGDLSAGVE